MDIWTGYQGIVCVLCWTLFQIACGNFTKYLVQEPYAGKLTYSVDFGVLVRNLLVCLTTCSFTTECGAAIYHRGNRTCYKINKHQYKYRLVDFIGAQMYMKGYCPGGWRRGYMSCYKFTGKNKTNQVDSEITCKGFSNKAHLADVNTDEEYDSIMKWTDLEDSIHAFWTGATYSDGWKWSDGTTMDNLIGFYLADKAYSEFTCLSLKLKSKKAFMSNCNYDVFNWQGLCELDLF